jgi:hypothetical protein
MAELLAEKIPARLYFATGGSTNVFHSYARKNGIPEERIVDLGGLGYQEIYDAISSKIENDSVILAIGNIVGFGEGMVSFLVEKSRSEP